MIATRRRRSRPQIGYRMPRDIERAMDELIDAGDYETRSDIISVAFRFWKTMQNFNVQDAVKTYLTSEEGRKLIISLMQNENKNSLDPNEF
jgi:Arc/MetJ-type ribon-helix-helix transcriptional regulator